MTQKELAAILKCSTPTIQAIELGKLAMSERLAERVSFETGISLDWLLAKDTKAPPIDEDGQPFTLQTFEGRQAEIARPKVKDSDAEHVNLVACVPYAEMLSVLLSAYRSGRFNLFAYKLGGAIKQLRKEFGEDKRNTYVAVGGKLKRWSPKTVVNAALDEFENLFEVEMQKNRPSPAKQKTPPKKRGAKR